MSRSLNVLHQPKPFYLIFFIELWERFGFYGLQALLAVYMVQEMGMTEAESFVTFGAFSAMVFGLMAIGGYIGDKLIGTKRTIVLGAVVMTIGYILMGVSDHNKNIVFLALSAVAVGNGLFKANPSCLLAKCYEKGDSRLDGAFIMYYMSINIGSFLSMAGVPYIAELYGWSIGFLCSAVGLIVGLVNYAFVRHWVADYGSEPDFKPVSFKLTFLLLVGIIISCGFGAWILNNLTIANTLLALLGIGVFLVFGKEIVASQGVVRRRMIVALVLMAEGVVFWVLYMQMPTSLNFFAIYNVEPNILGFEINPISFQSLNPFWIMVASPVLAYFSNMGSVGRRKLEMPAKFALGMLLTAVSFLVLPLGAMLASAEGIVSSGWLIFSYLFQALGELLISALGLAMVAQLVPDRMHGFIMGAWFLTLSAGSVIAGYVAAWTSVDTIENATAIETLPIYSSFFQSLGLATLGVAALTFAVAPWLTKMSKPSASELEQEDGSSPHLMEGAE
ncbi:oligopeptide:H+ symporter [Endozoicomonadaceae bacterium StTr2]